MNKKQRILQISDCHLLVNPSDSYRGFNPESRLDAVIKQVANQVITEGVFDHLLLTGDIAQQAESNVYQRILEKTAHLANHVHWIAGNHDDVKVMAQFDTQRQTIIHAGNWAFVLLDSTSSPDGRGSGSLAEDQLSLIEQVDDLDAKHIMLVLHHPPVDVGSLWQDQIKLANSDEFWRKLALLKKVRAVTFGHLHQEHHFDYQGVELFCVPATAPQFKKSQDTFLLEDDAQLSGPGYRVFELAEDGAIVSYIRHVDSV